MRKFTRDWDLEEIPYETGDPAGGWYLHFDRTGERTEAVLYMSKAHVGPADAQLIAAAPDLLAACKAAFVALPMTKHNEPINEQLKAAIAKADGADYANPTPRI